MEAHRGIVLLQNIFGKRCTRGAREGHERGTRGAFVGTKGDTVFFILTRLGHGWDTGTLAP